mgnify:FL=1
METNGSQFDGEFKEYKRLILEKLDSNNIRLKDLEKGWPEEQKLVLQTLEIYGERLAVMENQYQQLLLRVVKIETKCDLRHPIKPEQTDRVERKSKLNFSELPWKIIMLLLGIIGYMVVLLSKLIDLFAK